MIKKKTTQRRMFLRQLSEELAKPFIEDRFENSRITRNHSTKIAIESVLGVQLIPVDMAQKNEVRDNTGRKKVVGACHVCYRLTTKRRRKTRKSCANCEKPVCDEHSVSKTTCPDCAE